jgi:sphingosine-1-phosphate phosphatase 2
MGSCGSYLSDPNKVARFQLHFGVEGDFDENGKKEPKHRIKSKFWFYFFHVGASMGNEFFFTLFFAFCPWNVNYVVVRQASIVWAMMHYIGNATKDVWQIPRPTSPPVVKLEKRYFEEFGFPSVHVMTTMGLFGSFVYSLQLQYNVIFLVAYSTRYSL